MLNRNHPDFIDWDGLYYEIAEKIPFDPRFQYEGFKELTTVGSILSMVKLIRDKENLRLHNESIPISILAVISLQNKVKDPKALKEEDYQPFRHLVHGKEKAEGVPYDNYTKTQLQFALRYNLAPDWLGSIVRPAIKHFTEGKDYLPLCMSAPGFFGVGPKVSKKAIGFKALFIGPQPPREKAILYLQKKRLNEDVQFSKFGSIIIPREYLKPSLITLNASVEIDDVPNPIYWRS